MHVIQMAPPWYPIPPDGYGGIERVVYDLTEGLIAAGHRVTLFAPAGSRTSAELIPTVPGGIGLDMSDQEKEDRFLATSRRAFRIAAGLDADIVHDHTDYSPDPGFPTPIVRTIHGPAVEYHVAMYQAMSQRGDRFIAISHRQRELFEEAAASNGGGDIAFAGVIHNPIAVLKMPFYPASAKQDYAAFLGRCHWEKDPAAAIRVALSAGIHLKLALRVTSQEQRYFDEVIQPLLEEAGDRVEFLGEIGGREKSDVIGRARAVIFPSPWEEPFGLVLVEAAAHGTPVVALRRGAAPEIVQDGVTGILCENETEMARALPRAMRLDPVACRDHAERHFTRAVIAGEHIALYQRILGRVVTPQNALNAAR